jgi:hypothetical protein
MFGRHFSLCVVCILALCVRAEAEIGPMVPMDHIGPNATYVDLKQYAQVIRVAANGQHKSVSAALDSIRDASKTRRYAILVAAGTYNESRLTLKPFVDLYGAFARDGDSKARDVYQNATVLDAQKKGPVVIGADNARIDGFVITGGHHDGMGGGIVCDGVSPTITNNIIVGNNLPKPAWLKPPLGKQIANEGAGIALLNGSRAYVANNLIAENTTDAGNGGGITSRNNVHAKILRNVFANNIAGVKDDSEFHGKVGSRSSPGGAIAVNTESSPQIAFNVIVLGSAPINNDAGGIWVEGNSAPPISYNWIVGNLSGDDGGGIYVMGSLWYDEVGERHDSSPDKPVSIENNLIVGNTCIRGGPGGIRISRWGRVELRRNVIVGNQGGARGGEGGVISAAADNIIQDNEEKKTQGSPKFRFNGQITSRNFDEHRFVTAITTGSDLTALRTARNIFDTPGFDVLGGSIIRIGDQWSVVKSSEPNKLYVWGKITDQAPTFDLLDHYGRTEESPR